MIRPAKLEELKRYAKGKCPEDYMLMLGVERFAEIGIREGNSFFGKHIHGVGVEAYAIDIWKETGNPAQNDGGFAQGSLDAQYALVKSKSDKWNTEHSSPATFVIRDFSAEAAKAFDDEYFDWVFIDGDHSYEGCKEDIEAWYPKVKSGGVLCGHDYMLKDTFWRGIKVGVKQAVDEFFGDRGIEFYVYTNSECPTWYAVKP